VKAAHAMDVDVEAELGRVGIAANKGDFANEDLYTTVDQAVDFINKTRADALAIAIGSAHGYYVETPHLAMKRLQEINKAIDTPLVLHGGTGIPEDQLKQSFKLGSTSSTWPPNILPCSTRRLKISNRSKRKRIIFSACGIIRKK